MVLVPNALHFIDKYNQVPRILNPMVIAIEGIDRIARDPFIHQYIQDAFGGIDALKKSPPPLPPPAFEKVTDCSDSGGLF